MPDVDISIGADTSAAAAGFAELRNYAEKARADITRSFAGSIAVSVIATGITAGIQSVIEYGAKVYDLSQRFAVSSTAIQQFGNVAERSGSSLEGVAMGFNKLDIATSKALGGNQSVINAFARLGVSVDDLKNLSPEEIMLKIGHSSMDAADMVTILGRTGTQLRETLRKLADGVDEFGNAIDPGMIQKLKLADDRFKIFWQNVRIYGAEALDFIAQRSADVFDFLIPSFVQKWIGFGSLPQKPPPSPARAHVPPGGDQPTGPEGVPIGDEGDRGAESGDLSAADALSGGSGGGSRGGGGGLSKELSLRQQIQKIEEESAARNRTDEEQLSELQKQRVDLSERYQAASKASDFTDTKASLDAELALSKNQQEIDKLSGKIEDDKAAALKKVTDEREKEAAQAERELADAQESNKEIQLSLAGRKDLADRAKIQYDYEKQIADAKSQLYYDEEQARQAAERGDTAERDKWLAVADTNRALVEQLSLEEQNALAAHDKAQAEKQAAAVIEAKGKLTAAEESLGATDERFKELQLESIGRKDLADQAKTELQYDKQIVAARDEANSLWTQMADAYRDNNRAAGDLLANAAQLKDVEATRLESEKEMAVLLQQQAAGFIALGRGADAGQVRQLAPGQTVSGYDQFGRPVVQNKGGGGDLTIGDLASRGLRMGSTSLGLALAASGGEMSGPLFQRAYEHYSAIDQLQNLTGKNPYSFIDRARAQAALDAYGKKQNAIASAQSKKQTDEEAAYWSAIANGITPPADNPFTKMYGTVPRTDFTPGTPAAATGAPQGPASTLAQFTQLQHETALQRLTTSLPNLFGGASAPNVASSGSTQINKLEQQISLLQKAVTQLTSIDGRLKPAVGSHG